MSGLNSSMLIAAQALEVQQDALNTTTNNIANSNTPGYAREVVELSARPPTVEGNLSFGTGVQITGFQSIRDQVLQLRIYDETQQQASAQAQIGPTQQIEGVFSDPTQGIGADMQALFNSLNQLSNNPADTTLRQNVLSSADQLTGSFHTVSQTLSSIEQSLNGSVTQSVAEVNQLTAQIAQLNGEVTAKQQLGQDPGTLEDQREALIGQLAQQIDVQVIQTEQGQSLTTADGTPLVMGNGSTRLETSTDPSGKVEVFNSGNDITSTLKSGALGGALTVRDQSIPGLQGDLDNLASQFAAAMNSAQQGGFDLSGAAGQNLFTQAQGAGAARNIAVAFTDPSLIAASSDGTPGNNGNIANLLAVRDAALPSGATPLNAYAALASTAGDLSASAQTEAAASSASLQQLQDQRSSVSGVSLDEETTKMIQYQRAFQAAARVVSTVDDMTTSILSMGYAGA